MRSLVQMMIVVALCAGSGGCSRATARSTQGPPSTAGPPAVASGDAPGSALAPDELLAAAEDALAGEQLPRAVALFGRYLAQAGRGDGVPGLGQAYLGLANAHEKLGNCAAAIVARRAYLDRIAEAPERVTVQARIGACQAELGQWEGSAHAYAQVLADPGILPSLRIEAAARRGYALFMLERHDEAHAVLVKADEALEQVQRDQSERLSTYYFVGMARFYRAAIVHRKFRDIEIALPDKAMATAYEAKMKLLVEAQDAYNHTIRAKHVFWVSAAGYQLGHLFGEFYDALMYAPVPDWLDARQRGVYFEELKKQLRPVINKAIWVFEKNLETARRLGYKNPFIEKTEQTLGHLQGVLHAGDDTLASTLDGRPAKRLVPDAVSALAPPPDAAQAQLPVAERKLFVPRPTSL